MNGESHIAGLVLTFAACPPLGNDLLWNYMSWLFRWSQWSQF